MKSNISMLAFSVAVALSSQVAANSAPPTKPAAKAPAHTAAGAHKTAAPSHAAAAKSGGNAAFNTYATDLRQKMAKAWVYPLGKFHVTLTITIGQDGSVSNLTLDSAPKSAEAEQKANDAFNSAQPLPALPSGTSEAVITAVFDSDADQWNTKAANLMVKIDPKAQAATPAGEPAADGTAAPADADKK